MQPRVGEAQTFVVYMLEKLKHLSFICRSTSNEIYSKAKYAYITPRSHLRNVNVHHSMSSPWETETPLHVISFAKNETETHSRHYLGTVKPKPKQLNVRLEFDRSLALQNTRLGCHSCCWIVVQNPHSGSGRSVVCPRLGHVGRLTRCGFLR